MIPTKAMRPLTDTAAAVPIVAAATMSSRTRATFTPRLVASSSPRLNTSRTRRCNKMTSELPPISRAEPRSRCDAEQVRVGERVAEHALIGGACDREHPADERGEHDARRANLPHDGRFDATQRRVGVDEREMRERGDGDRPESDGHRADAESDDDRSGEERERAEPRRPRDSAGANACVRAPE